MRVSWTTRTSNQPILKEVNAEYSLEGLMLKLKVRYFGHLIRRAKSLEKTLMLGKIEERRISGQQRMRWLDCNVREDEQTAGDSEGQGNLASFSPWGHRVRHN